MNIRTKFQMVTFIIPIVLIGSIAAYCYLVVVPHYSQIETARVGERMDRVRNMYDYMASNLDFMNWDWASWDDMYEYVESRDQEFIDSNYVPGSFINNGVNIMLIVDLDGNMIFGRQFDFETGLEVPISNELLSLVTECCMYNTSGTVILEDKVGLFSSRPILTSTDEGPERGSHIMVRIIDEACVEELSLLTQQNVTIGLVDEPLTWDVVIEVKNEDTIEVSSLLPDNHDQNVAQISFDYDRSLFQMGTDNMWMLLGYLLVFAIVFIGISHYLANVLVLSRLSKLNNKLQELSDQINTGQRLGDEGEDEIGSVSRNINRLLDRIEAAQIVEAEQRESIEEIRRNHYLDLIDSVRKISHLLNNEMTKPLSSAKNVAYMLRQEDNTELADVLESSLSQGEKIVYELSSLTTMSEVRKTVTDLSEIIDAAIISTPKPNNITFEKRIDDEFLALMLDGAKMTRVFENIILNSVEAMPRGGTVTISSRDSDEGIIVEIKDSGEGLSDDDMENLFTPFYTSKQDAIGFGLVYAKQVVEAHGGTITIQSIKDEGTTVSVYLPRGSNGSA